MRSRLVAGLVAGSGALGYAVARRPVLPLRRRAVLTRAPDAPTRPDREPAESTSHRLRTPITALRLSLEDLANWPQTPAEVGAELRRSLSELDRLSAAVTLVMQERGEPALTSEDDLDLTRLVRERVHRARPGALAGGHELRCAPGGTVTARLPAEPVQEILDTLLSRVVTSALPHAPIVIETTDHRTHLSVHMAPVSEGATTPDPRQEASGSLGAGLEQTRLLVGTLHGHLSVESMPRPGLTLRLPHQLAGTPH